jgi:hypothetical protein
MRQSDLNREVARATGETIDRIGRIGFTVETPRPPRKITRRLRRRKGRLQLAIVAV